MNLKSKILAAGLAAIIAGFGMFAVNINTVQAQTDNGDANPAIAQMMQMIETLKQQIQQIIALIAQLKPQETCGNGKCRFGETAATCAADCSISTSCIEKDIIFQDESKRCCNGLEKVKLSATCNTNSQTTCASAISYTCQEEITATCAEACKTKGYAISRCNAWSTGTLTPNTNTGCFTGEIDLGWKSDCTASQLAGGGRACCCAKSETVCTPKKVSGCNICNNTGTKWIPTDTKCATGETCVNGECANSDMGKTKCTATGGTWVNSDCAGCIPQTRTERITSSMVCAKICVSGKICQCGNGKYWGSREEGCINNTAPTCGNGICNLEESATDCPADCNNCVIGFKANECCGCPQKISRSLVGTNGWVAYEKGKDYSAFPKKENCAGISCSPCGEVNAISQNNCALCGNGTCETGETAATCPADCVAAENKTCADLCKFKGYTVSRCNMWSTGTINTDPNAGCKASELNLGWTSDCTPTLGGTGGRACCCETKAPATIITPEICLKPLGSTITAAQKEACIKANGQIVCSNQCYCACGQSGNNNENVQTATEGPSWEGTIPAIDIKNLGANLSQAIETVKSILDKLILQK